MITSRTAPLLLLPLALASIASNAKMEEMISTKMRTATSATAVHSSVHNCCVGRVFTFAAPAFTYAPLLYYDATAAPGANNCGRHSGFYMKTLDMIVSEMGMELQCKLLPNYNSYVPAPPGVLTFKEGLERYNVTAIVASVSYTNNWLREVQQGIVFSIPISIGPMQGVVHRTPTTSGVFSLFAPFSDELWAAVAGCTFTIALGLVMLDVCEKIQKSVGIRDALWHAVRVTPKATYHAWTGLLGGDDYEYVTWPARMMRISVLFFVLIISATYTANLASFFVNRAYTIHGPQDMVALQSSSVCVRHQEFCTQHKFSEWAAECVSPGSGALPYTYQERLEFCFEMVEQHEADIFIEDRDVLNQYLSLDCDKNKHFFMPPRVELPIANVFGYAFKNTDRELAGNFSVAASELMNTNVWQSYQASLLGKGHSCEEEAASDQISLESMYGAIYIFFSLFLLACLLGLAHAAGWFERTSNDDSEEVLMTEGEMLRQLADNQASLVAVENDRGMLKQMLANQSTVMESLRDVQHLVAAAQEAQLKAAQESQIQGSEIIKQSNMAFYDNLISLDSLTLGATRSSTAHADTPDQSSAVPVPASRGSEIPGFC